MIADNRTPCCGTCRYFTPVTVEVKEISAEREFGQCRRWPPQLLKPGMMNGVFPVIEPDDWCGEHDYDSDLSCE